MRKQNYINYFPIPIHLSVLASHHDLSFVVELFFCISQVEVIYIYIINALQRSDKFAFFNSLFFTYKMLRNIFQKL
jgi:hypothetical protein